MHKKFSAQGLVVMTVCVTNTDLKAKGHERMLEKKFPFLHIHLAEDEELWQEKLGFSLVPCYFLFDRKGKWLRLSPNDAAFKEPADLYPAMEKHIANMLAER